jgi:hypothetical protein
MADTIRSLATLQGLLADNAAGDISAQDARDMLVSVDPENAIGTGTFAARPANRKGGFLYAPNDGFFLSRDTGAAWANFGPLFPFTAPVDGDFAWVNQGTATVTTTNGGIALYAPASTGFELRCRVKTPPATPYTITAYIRPTIYPSANCLAGLVFRQSSDGKLATFSVGAHAGGIRFQSGKWTNATTFSAAYSEIAPTIVPNWMRIADDGSNRIVSFSDDGQNFIPFHTVGRTDFITADQVGFFAQANTRDVYLTLLHWKEA